MTSWTLATTGVEVDVAVSVHGCDAPFREIE